MVRGHVGVGHRDDAVTRMKTARACAEANSDAATLPISNRAAVSGNNSPSAGATSPATSAATTRSATASWVSQRRS